MEINNVTSTEMIFPTRFVFWESEKEDKVTWDLKACQALLKDQENMLNVVVTDRDTALMNLIAKVFPTSYTLFYRYYIIKNVRSRIKSAVGTK